MPNFSADTLRDFATRLLSAGGISSDEAALVARSLIDANLRGHDSHGIMRVPSYLDMFRKGEVVAGAPLVALRESPSILVADGGWGFGQTQAQRLTQKLIAMARETGLAIGTLVQRATWDAWANIVRRQPMRAWFP